MTSAPSSPNIRALFDAFVSASTATETVSAFAGLKSAAALGKTDCGDAANHATNNDESHPNPPLNEHFYVKLKNALLPSLPYKHKALFDALDARWNRCSHLRDRTITSSPSTPQKPLLISGAGPCGLRAAVEALLLGIEVELIDLRTDFSRHNILKTWQATVDDLLSLGLAQFVPGFRKHGVLHCPTRDIQACLLKAGLLLGCTVRLGTGVCGVLDPSFVESREGAETEEEGKGGGEWRVWTLPEDGARIYLKKEQEKKEAEEETDGQEDGSADTTTEEEPPEFALRPGEQDVSRLQRTSKVDYFEPADPDPKAILSGPNGRLSTKDREAYYLLHNPTNPNHPTQSNKATVIPFSTLIIAEGESSRLIRRLGFARKVSRFNNAIGIVVNLDFSPTANLASSPERSIAESIAWRTSADWKKTVLGPLAESGIELENLEYLRGTSTHFIAATTKIPHLITLGIVKSDRGKVRDTLTPENVDLDKLRGLARTMAAQLGIPSTAPLSSKHGVQIFDFSARGLCSDLVRVLHPSSGSTNQAKTLVLPIGDSLQNPYWPQGLGINRGFHNALDGIWSAFLFLTSPQEISQAIEERKDAFRTMDYLTFGPHCVNDANNWTADPCTRYAYGVYKRRHLEDVEMGRAPTVIARVREKLGLRDGVVPAGGGGGTA